MKKSSHILVDINALCSIQYECNGCKGYKGACCCGCYDICITRKEVSQLIGVLPAVTQYCPHLVDDDDFDNMFEPEGKGLYSIDTDERGLCVFAYKKKGMTLCGVHSATLDLGVPLEKVKAEVCMLWPLALSEGEVPVLGVQSDAFTFPCNSKKQTNQLCAGVVEILEQVFGTKFRIQVESALQKGKDKIKVTM